MGARRGCVRRSRGAGHIRCSERAPRQLTDDEAQRLLLALRDFLGGKQYVVGNIKGGDRLPWVAMAAGSNFDRLHSMDWQLHVYGEATEPLQVTCRIFALELHTFNWSEAARSAGLLRDAAYLIRPDGYVACTFPEQQVETLHAYVEQFGLRF